MSSIAGKSDHEIVGFNDNKNLECIRQPGEPLAALIKRAFAVTGSQFLYASYAASETAPERDCEAAGHSAPSRA